MEKHIRQTSIDVYHQIVEKGLLSKRRWQVYSCLFEHGPMTQNETYVKLGVPNLQQSSVMPRFAELKNMGVIREIGTRKCTITGHEVLEWDVTDQLPIDFKRKSKKELKEELLNDIVNLGLKLPEHFRVSLRNIHRKLKEL